MHVCVHVRETETERERFARDIKVMLYFFSILNISGEHNNKSFYEGRDHICIVPAGISNP